MLLPINYTVTNDQGTVVPGASVTIVDADDQTVAELFADADGTAPLDNPFDADASGVALCYVPPGLYGLDANAVFGGLIGRKRGIVVAVPTDYMRCDANGLDIEDPEEFKDNLGLGPDASKEDAANKSNDGTMAADSATLFPTQHAVIAYFAAMLAALDYAYLAGGIDASGNPNYPAANAGAVYKFTVAGKIGGGSGVTVQVGDTALCFVDNSPAGTQAAVGANWIILQTNLDISNDTTLAADSALVIATQHAVKTYADTLFAGVPARLAVNGNANVGTLTFAGASVSADAGNPKTATVTVPTPTDQRVSLTAPPTSDWTTLNAGANAFESSAAAQTIKGARGETSATGLTALIRDMAAAPSVYTIGITASCVNAGTVGVGMVLHDSISGRCEEFYYSNGQIVVGTHTSAASGNTPTVVASVNIAAVPDGQLFWFRVRDNGVKLCYQYSANGEDYITLLVRSRTAFLTNGPNKVGFGYNYGANSSSSYELVERLVSYVESVPAASVVTMNPSDKSASIILSNNNCRITQATGTNSLAKVRATTGFSSGKKYWETIVLALNGNTDIKFGFDALVNALTTDLAAGNPSFSAAADSAAGLIVFNNTFNSSVGGMVVGDVYRHGLDLDNNRYNVTRGEWVTVPDNDAHAFTYYAVSPATYFPAMTMVSGVGNTPAVLQFNLNEASLLYPVPNGYTAYSA